MNKHVKLYLEALEETLICKYDISSHKAKTIIQDSYIIDCLRGYPEDTLHDDIETHADNIYGDWIEERRNKCQ